MADLDGSQRLVKHESDAEPHMRPLAGLYRGTNLRKSVGRGVVKGSWLNGSHPARASQYPTKYVAYHHQTVSFCQAGLCRRTSPSPATTPGVSALRCRGPNRVPGSLCSRRIDLHTISTRWSTASLIMTEWLSRDQHVEALLYAAVEQGLRQVRIAFAVYSIFWAEFRQRL